MFGVWPDNWKAMQAFLALDTQWRVGAGGGFLGLDYGAAAALFKGRSTRAFAALMMRVKHIEAGALQELNRREDQAQEGAP
ncbi:MAG: DUF1799 domain-containing protein [Pseudomonadota bacterium]